MIIRVNKRKVNNGVTVVNYADKTFTQSQKLNTKTALKVGRVKKVISYTPIDIDEEFYAKNKAILDKKRGGGYWLWKPYVIKKALSEIQDGEYLFYCDSGSVFVNAIDHLISSFDKKFDLMPFEMQLIEKHWTKRDCFQIMRCDELEMVESKQIQATFVLLKKTDFSMFFLDEWLKFAQDSRVLTDIDNQLGLPNHEGFIDHRHDQSIFSLLIKKYGIKKYRDPSQFGGKFEELYPNSKYPQIVSSTRQKNISFFERVKKRGKSFMIVKIIISIIKKKSSKSHINK